MMQCNWITCRMLAKKPKLQLWCNEIPKFPRSWQKSTFLAVICCKSKNSKIFAKNPLFQQWCNVIEENPGSWQNIPVFSSDSKYFKKFRGFGSKSLILAVVHCKWIISIMLGNLEKFWQWCIVNSEIASFWQEIKDFSSGAV